MGALRLYCLSGHPNKPCLVLKWPDVTIMLDCGLDMRTILQYLPIPLLESDRLKNLPPYRPPDQQKVMKQLRECCKQIFVDGIVEVCPPDSSLIDFGEIDAILISNYNSMLALPFVTERTKFRGAVYATEPTIQYGRLLMEELVEYVERGSKTLADPSWKSADLYRHFIMASDMNPNLWGKLYTSNEVGSALARIKPVAHSEILDVCGLLNVTSVSSGICIGASNWIIQTDYEKIVYLASSSNLLAHPKHLDTESLKNADVMVISALTQAPHQHPDTMLGVIFDAVVNTIRNGGNVLIPCYPMGLIYDLLEYITSQLDSNHFTHVPIYVVSHVADSALAYGNIYAEWLADPKQSKVFIPEEPFLHGQLIKNGRVKPYNCIQGDLSKDFRSPCVVFASHPSLRLGDAVHFMELWSSDVKNTIVLTEPDFCTPEVLAPYAPMAMRAAYCPIDTSLNFAQINSLLPELRPRAIYIPDKYRKPPAEFSAYPEYCIQYEPTPISFRKYQVFSIPYYKNFVKVKVDPELATKINFRKVKGSEVTSICGSLSYYGNRLVLEASEDEKSAYPIPYGSLDLTKFLDELKKNGFTPVEDRSMKNRKRIRLENEKITIESMEDDADQEQSGSSTHVTCEEVNEPTRKKLIDILFQAVPNF